MRRSPRHPRSRRLTPALALLTTLCGPPALAQYRPPPMSEAQRLVHDGESAQVAASAASASGDKKEAEEKYRKALALFEQALTAEPGSVTAAAGLGASANALNDWQRTVDRVQPVLAANPAELDLAYPVSVALFKLRRFPEAVPLMEQVATADKAEHLIVHYYLASYYLYVQQGDAAATRLKRYLALRPRALAPNDFQIHELLGRAHVLRRDAAQARASFQQAQAGRTESPSVQFGLAQVLELEGKLVEARKLLEGVTTRFPRAGDAREKLARLYLGAGDVAKADAQAQALVKLGSSPAAHLLLGDVRFAQKNAAAAEAEYRKVLQLQPGLVLGQMAVGKALQAQGRHEEAIQFLESAVRAGANSLELWANLGSVNRRAGRFQRAVEVHRRVVELAPRQALGYVLLGADHFATGQWDQAIEDYASALQVEPEHAGAKLWLARALAHRARDRAGAGRLEDAVRDLRRAYDLERAAPMARRLGAALLETKAYADARKVLEQGVTLPGAAWRDHLLLGYARLATHDAQAALEAFTRAGTQTEEPDEQAETSVGAALAEVELGQVDAAVSPSTISSPTRRSAGCGWTGPWWRRTTTPRCSAGTWSPARCPPIRDRRRACCWPAARPGSSARRACWARWRTRRGRTDWCVWTRCSRWCWCSTAGPRRGWRRWAWWRSSWPPAGWRARRRWRRSTWPTSSSGGSRWPWWWASRGPCAATWGWASGWGRRSRRRGCWRFPPPGCRAGACASRWWAVSWATGWSCPRGGGSSRASSSRRTWCCPRPRCTAAAWASETRRGGASACSGWSAPGAGRRPRGARGCSRRWGAPWVRRCHCPRPRRWGAGPPCIRCGRPAARRARWPVGCWRTGGSWGWRW